MSNVTPAAGTTPAAPPQTAQRLYAAYFEGLHTEDKVAAAMADLAGAPVELAFMAPHLQYLLLQQLGRNERALGILIKEVRKLNNFADRDNHIQVEISQSNAAIADGLGLVLQTVEEVLTAPEPAQRDDSEAPSFTRARAGMHAVDDEGDDESGVEGEIFMEDGDTTYVDVSDQAAGGAQ